MYTLPILTKCSLFHGLKPTRLAQLCHAARVLRFGPGTLLAQQGSLPSGLYIILSGSVVAELALPLHVIQAFADQPEVMANTTGGASGQSRTKSMESSSSSTPKHQGRDIPLLPGNLLLPSVFISPNSSLPSSFPSSPYPPGLLSSDGTMFTPPNASSVSSRSLMFDTGKANLSTMLGALKPLVLATLGEGDILGEASLLSYSDSYAFRSHLNLTYRTASSSATRLLYFSADRLLALLPRKTITRLRQSFVLRNTRRLQYLPVVLRRVLPAVGIGSITEGKATTASTTSTSSNLPSPEDGWDETTLAGDANDINFSSSSATKTKKTGPQLGAIVDTIVAAVVAHNVAVNQALLSAATSLASRFAAAQTSVSPFRGDAASNSFASPDPGQRDKVLGSHENETERRGPLVGDKGTGGGKSKTGHGKGTAPHVHYLACAAFQHFLPIAPYHSTSTPVWTHNVVATLPTPLATSFATAANVIVNNPYSLGYNMWQAALVAAAATTMYAALASQLFELPPFLLTAASTPSGLLGPSGMLPKRTLSLTPPITNPQYTALVGGQLDPTLVSALSGPSGSLGAAGGLGGSGLGGGLSGGTGNPFDVAEDGRSGQVLTATAQASAQSALMALTAMASATSLIPPWSISASAWLDTVRIRVPILPMLIRGDVVADWRPVPQRLPCFSSAYTAPVVSLDALEVSSAGASLGSSNTSLTISGASLSSHSSPYQTSSNPSVLRLPSQALVATSPILLNTDVDMAPLSALTKRLLPPYSHLTQPFSDPLVTTHNSSTLITDPVALSAPGATDPYTVSCNPLAYSLPCVVPGPASAPSSVFAAYAATTGIPVKHLKRLISPTGAVDLTQGKFAEVIVDPSSADLSPSHNIHDDDTEWQNRLTAGMGGSGSGLSSGSDDHRTVEQLLQERAEGIEGQPLSEMYFKESGISLSSIGAISVLGTHDMANKVAERHGNTGDSVNLVTSRGVKVDNGNASTSIHGSQAGGSGGVGTVGQSGGHSGRPVLTASGKVTMEMTGPGVVVNSSLQRRRARCRYKVSIILYISISLT